MVPVRSASACSSPPRGRSPGFVRACVLGIALAFASLACAHGRQREGSVTVLEIATDTVDADVWVDGEYIGQVAAVSGKLRLGPGVHRVELRKPGHFPVQRTVRVDKQAGGAVVVEAELLADPR